MEPSRKRTGWIIFGAVLVALVCLAAALVVAAVGWFTDWSFTTSDRNSPYSTAHEVIERSFELGDAPILEIDNFAGSVTVRAAESDTIEVVATKRARSGSNVERIVVDMAERGNKLLIQTEKPRSVRNAWVELEITAPLPTELDLRTGSGGVDVVGLTSHVRVYTGSGSVHVADIVGDVSIASGSGSLNIADVRGNVTVNTGSGSIDVDDVAGDVTLDTGSGSIDIRDVKGEIDAHTSSGGIEASGAEGLVSLDTGSGGIEYQGTPGGECRFTTGSGSIKLTMPPSTEMEVDLTTGSGTIDCEFAVVGRKTREEVTGTIGSGDGGSIYARTGSGRIFLSSQKLGKR